MKNSFLISFGLWLIILPLLGIPGVWRNSLVFASGFLLVLYELGPIILRKLQTKPKLRRRKSEAKPNAVMVEPPLISSEEPKEE